MKKVVQFEAFGLRAVPWSVPDIGVSDRGGKRHRFARRTKKSRLHEGAASLEDWQRFVAAAARLAMSTVSIPLGPVKLHIEFYAKTPPGLRHGQLWEVPLRWNEETSKFGKTQPRGTPEPDLVNLFKGAEDAVAGVILADDVQCRIVSSVTLYGPRDGLRVFLHAIEPDDFPGHGGPDE